MKKKSNQSKRIKFRIKPLWERGLFYLIFVWPTWEDMQGYIDKFCKGDCEAIYFPESNFQPNSKKIGELHFYNPPTQELVAHELTHAVHHFSRIFSLRAEEKKAQLLGHLTKEFWTNFSLQAQR